MLTNKILLSHDALHGSEAAKWLTGKVIFHVLLVDLSDIVIIPTPGTLLLIISVTGNILNSFKDNCCIICGKVTLI